MVVCRQWRSGAGLFGVVPFACVPWGYSWSLLWMQVVTGLASRAIEWVAVLGQVLVQAGSSGWASGLTFGEVVGDMGGADAVGPPITSRGAGHQRSPLPPPLFSDLATP